MWFQEVLNNRKLQRSELTMWNMNVLLQQKTVMGTTCLGEYCASTRFSPILTYAFPLIRHSDGPSQDASGSPEMAGAGVHDPIVPAQVLLGWDHFGAKPVAGYAVGIVGLVQYARRTSRTAHIIARLCVRNTAGINQVMRWTVTYILGDISERSEKVWRPTFAFSLVLYGQVGMFLALGPEEGTFGPVRFPIRATHRPLQGDVGAVWGAHTPRFIPLVHFALLSGTTVHIIASLCRINTHKHIIKWAIYAFVLNKINQTWLMLRLFPADGTAR